MYCFVKQKSTAEDKYPHIQSWTSQNKRANNRVNLTRKIKKTKQSLKIHNGANYKSKGIRHLVFKCNTILCIGGICETKSINLWSNNW